MNRSIAAIVFVLASIFHGTAFSKELFDMDAFKALQAQDAVILVDVYANWCPTCRKQSRIIESYLEEHPDSGLQVLTVDFDDQKDYVRHFKAPRQSTLLIYKGEEQLWFSVAATSKSIIYEQLDKATGAQ
ncbi:MAG: thioredoxin family protein [Gammaproteobacteria bacterium]